MFRLPIKGSYYLARGKVSPFLSVGVIPSLVELDTEHSGSKHHDSYVSALTSIGPGILLGKLYVVVFYQNKKDSYQVMAITLIFSWGIYFKNILPGITYEKKRLLKAREKTKQ